MTYPAMPNLAVDGADFDGTNDWMTRGADLTGDADSKTGIFSSWIRADSLAATAEILRGNFIVGGTTGRFQVFINTLGNIAVNGFNSASTQILGLITSGGSITVGSGWHHILIAWDLAAGASAIYIDDVSDQTVNFRTNDSINYVSSGDWAIGAASNGSEKLNGCLAELYFAPGQYLDFSSMYNRRKFRSSDGRPVYMGTDGSKPTGTAPLIYCHLDNGETVADFATNRGTGGNFSISGALATASTSPSD